MPVYPRPFRELRLDTSENQPGGEVFTHIPVNVLKVNFLFSRDLDLP